MPTIINVNLLLAACQYTSVSAERKDWSNKWNDLLWEKSPCIDHIRCNKRS